MNTPAPAPLAPPLEFQQPWQLRAYVIANVLVQRDLVDRGALAQGAGEEALRSWLSTVERTLLDRGDISAEELEAEVARHAAVAASRSVH